jgi:hypothetical protein
MRNLLNKLTPLKLDCFPAGLIDILTREASFQAIRKDEIH